MVNLVNGKPWYPFWEEQADGVVAEAPPVSGTQYVLLAQTNHVMIKGIAVQVTWTVQPTPLEIHINIDGQTIIHTFANPVTATVYYAETQPWFTALTQLLQVGAPNRAFLYMGKTVSVYAETTGGTVQNLDARIKWARML